jgi:hypothetical protein
MCAPKKKGGLLQSRKVAHFIKILDSLVNESMNDCTDMSECGRGLFERTEFDNIHHLNHNKTLM